MKHSDETKARLSRKSKEFQASLIATRLEKYGSCNHTLGGNKQPFSRCKGGRRADLGDRYFRSAWEANYARYLTWLKSLGKIKEWAYESKTFRFEGIKRGCITYTPDFLVVELDGTERYHEVKGWMTQQSKTRLKRMAKYFPDVEIVLIKENEYKKLAKTVAGFIPCWE